MRQFDLAAHTWQYFILSGCNRLWQLPCASQNFSPGQTWHPAHLSRHDDRVTVGSKLPPSRSLGFLWRVREHDPASPHVAAPRASHQVVQIAYFLPHILRGRSVSNITFFRGTSRFKDRHSQKTAMLARHVEERNVRGMERVKVL